jgi:phosphoribosylpyrophosphate synthetase
LELLIALGRQHIKSFTVIINYFAPGTKERVDQPGELARAQTTAQLISKSLKAVPVMGPATVIIYDIHAVQEQFYFPDPCSLQLQSSTPLMGKVVADEKMVLVFPDQGAYKRFGKEAELKNVPTLICNKERGHNDSRVIVIADRKNCGGLTDAELFKRHLVIYDDIGHSGSTSWETFCMLKKQGFETISLYVTHAVFSLHAWMRFLPSGDRAGFHRIYTTNSVPSMTERYLKFYPETFTVLDLTKLTAEFICTKYDIRYSAHTRLSSPLEFEVWYGTTSKPKVDAIHSVFPNAKFLDGTDTSTGVNPQPVGYVEIYTGVGNRMTNLTRAWRSLVAKRELTSHSHTVLIAIETGLVRTPSGVLRD